MSSPNRIRQRVARTKLVAGTAVAGAALILAPAPSQPATGTPVTAPPAAPPPVACQQELSAWTSAPRVADLWSLAPKTSPSRIPSADCWQYVQPHSREVVTLEEALRVGIKEAPDLQNLPPSELSVVERDGGLALRLGNSIANTGKAPLIVKVMASPTTGDGRQAVFQPVQLVDGRLVWVRAGALEFHGIHDHFHLLPGVAKFTVRAATHLGDPIAPENVVLAESDKVTYCMINVHRVLEGDLEDEGGFSGWCEDDMQGIGSGWADRYGPDIDGQEVRLPEGAKPGDRFWVVTVANVAGTLAETDYANNVGATLVELEQDRSVKVLKEVGLEPEVPVPEVRASHLYGRYPQVSDPTPMVAPTK